MSLARDTVRGAFWTVTAGMASRALGLVGTLIVTRFVTPADYGEVMVAAVLVMSANQFSTLGLGQFLIAKPDAGRAAAFHATVFHVLLGAVALLSLLLLGSRLGPALEAPGLTAFLPGLVLSALLDRLAFVPERILVRDVRFGTIGAARTAGDLAFSSLSVLLAATGWGASSLVLGNVARSFVRMVWFTRVVDRRDWFEPCRLSLRKARELLAFGVPMSAGALCAFAARRWDNLLVARFFGAGTTGMYNLAYNLADVPAIQVGEQIGDVLLPSFARMDVARRPSALVRSITLLAIVVFPLAIGLGAVAPTLVAALFDAHWRPVGPMLVLLSALSVTRPIGWTIASYLQARRMPRAIMGLEFFKLVVILLALLTLGRIGPLWACTAVGLAFAAHALASLWLVRRIDGIPLRRMLNNLGPVLAACALMVAAVLGARWLLASWGGAAILHLVIEMSVGALSYPLALWLFARDDSRELVARLTDALTPRAAA
jgi:PST family polysaccharide transporter